MSTSRCKALLFLCAIGVAGCNKIRNTSYMDGGGDRKEESKEKRQKVSDLYGESKAGSSSTEIVRYGSVDYHKMMEDSLGGMKEAVSIAEEICISKQEALDHAKEALECAKNSLEMKRKIADDAERGSLELAGGDTSSSACTKGKDWDGKDMATRLNLGDGGYLLGSISLVKY